MASTVEDRTEAVSIKSALAMGGTLVHVGGRQVLRVAEHHVDGEAECVLRKGLDRAPLRPPGSLCPTVSRMCTVEGILREHLALHAQTWSGAWGPACGHCTGSRVLAQPHPRSPLPGCGSGSGQAEDHPAGTLRQEGQRLFG